VTECLAIGRRWRRRCDTFMSTGWCTGREAVEHHFRGKARRSWRTSAGDGGRRDPLLCGDRRLHCTRGTGPSAGGYLQPRQSSLPNGDGPGSSGFPDLPVDLDKLRTDRHCSSSTRSSSKPARRIPDGGTGPRRKSSGILSALSWAFVALARAGEHAARVTRRAAPPPSRSQRCSSLRRCSCPDRRLFRNGREPRHQGRFSCCLSAAQPEIGRVNKLPAG